ncbi:MAG: TerC/Alx family metal homeostasis membrane protein [Saprospiraceae bacterium]
MSPYLPWIVLLVHVLVLLGLDFFVFHRRDEVPRTRRAVAETIFFVINALAFAGFIYWYYLSDPAVNINELAPRRAVINYLTGYAVELSLSVDNLFVIAAIFTAYHIPPKYQHRVLFLGILGAIVFRALLIGIGLALVHQIEQITIFFGLFLLYSAIKMLTKKESQEGVRESGRISRLFNISPVIDGHNLRTTIDGKRVFTALFGALITIEFTDLLFALDSVPAIFAVTTDPYIVFSSNIFAILGLRSLYFFLAGMLSRFAYLQYSVFAILIFVSVKLITASFFDIPEWFSLLFIFISLGIGIIVSLSRKPVT